MCSYERTGWLGCRDLGFSNQDLGKRAGNFAIWTLHPGYRDEQRDKFWRSGWHCIACCIFHIISIPFNCSDTALRVTDAKIGRNLKFVFRFFFVSRIWRQNSSPVSLTFSHLRNRAEISHMNPRQNSSRQPSQPGQPGSYEEALSCCFLFQVLKIPAKVLFFCAPITFGANKYFITLEQWWSLIISWQDDRSCQTVIYFTRNDGCVDTWL